MSECLHGVRRDVMQCNACEAMEAEAECERLRDQVRQMNAALNQANVMNFNLLLERTEAGRQRDEVLAENAELFQSREHYSAAWRQAVQERDEAVAKLADIRARHQESAEAWMERIMAAEKERDDANRALEVERAAHRATAEQRDGALAEDAECARLREELEEAKCAVARAHRAGCACVYCEHLQRLQEAAEQHKRPPT